VADRYYVGGNGSKWDLTSSWATSSGGTPGASVPTSADNIFFDPNSGLQSASNITYNTSSTLNCNNVTFSQAGIVGFGMGSPLMTLNVYGSAVLLNLTGPPLIVTFLGTGAQTIQATNIVGGSIEYVVNSQPLSLTLQSDLTCITITHSGGTFDLNNYNVNCAAFSTSTSTTGTLYLRNSTLTVTSAFQLQSTTITLVPGNATVQITGAYGLYLGAPAVNMVVTTGGVTFNSSTTINTLQLARGYAYQFTPGIVITVVKPIQQKGSGQTTIGLAGTGSNFTLSSHAGYQQYLSNVTMNGCSALGSGTPFLAIGSSSLTKPPSANACTGWIGPKAIGFAGD